MHILQAQSISRVQSFMAFVECMACVCTLPTLLGLALAARTAMTPKLTASYWEPCCFIEGFRWRFVRGCKHGYWCQTCLRHVRWCAGRVRGAAGEAAGGAKAAAQPGGHDQVAQQPGLPPPPLLLPPQATARALHSCVQTRSLPLPRMRPTLLATHGIYRVPSHMLSCWA